MPRPTLVIVSGPAGTGKTTLAHELAWSIGCPAISRDEIKEGMVHTVGEFEAAPDDPLTQRTLPVFFNVLQMLLENEVSVVAEAAFQHKVWRPNLTPILPIADIRVVQCHADPRVVRNRFIDRGISRRGCRRCLARRLGAPGPRLPPSVDQGPVDRRRHDRRLPALARRRRRVRQLTSRGSRLAQPQRPPSE